MREVANIDTVRSLYSAFGRGDLAGILERLDETIVWITPGEPPMPLTAVAPERIELLAEALEKYLARGARKPPG